MDIEMSSPCLVGKRKCDNKKCNSLAAEMEFSDKIAFLWIIEDVMNCPPIFPYLVKSGVEFEVEDDANRKFWVTLLDNEDHFKLIISKISSFTCLLSVSVSICLLDHEFAASHEVASTMYVTEKGHSPLFSFPEFLKKDELLKGQKKFLHKGDLILYGQIMILEQVVHYHTSIASESHFLQDISSLSKHATLSDFKIIVQGKEFHCNKAVLAARSEFFAALLRNDMKEKKENILVLNDIKSDVFQQILNYIYTNEVDISEANVLPLLEAAEKYLLNGLKIHCEKNLCNNIRFCNLSKIKSIADIFPLPYLKQTVLYTWALFSNYFPGKVASDLLRGKSNVDFPSNDTQASVACLKDLHLPVDKILPFVNVWASTNNHILLKKRWRIKGIRDLTEGKYVPLVYRFRSIDLGIMCQIKIDAVNECKHQRIIVRFTLLSSVKETGKFEFLTSLINSTGLKRQPGYFSEDLSIGVEYNLVQCIVQHESMDLFHGSDIIIKCEGWVRKSSLHRLKTPFQKSTLLSDISSLLINNDFSDLIIKVSGKEFLCHKAIVACRSPYLAKMLKTNSNRNILELQDINPLIFEKILSYIYTDLYKLVETEAWELLAYASRFEMEHLKVLCEKALVTSLNIQNARETLNYSISYSSSIVQEYALKFIRKHFSEILESESQMKS